MTEHEQHLMALFATGASIALIAKVSGADMDYDQTHSRIAQTAFRFGRTMALEYSKAVQADKTPERT